MQPTTPDDAMNSSNRAHVERDGGRKFSAARADADSWQDAVMPKSETHKIKRPLSSTTSRAVTQSLCILKELLRSSRPVRSRTGPRPSDLDTSKDVPTHVTFSDDECSDVHRGGCATLCVRLQKDRLMGLEGTMSGWPEETSGVASRDRRVFELEKRAEGCQEGSIGARLQGSVLSIKECLQRLPAGFNWPTHFRQKSVRLDGTSAPQAAMLTEEDFIAVMEGLRPCSNSRAGQGGHRQIRGTVRGERYREARHYFRTACPSHPCRRQNESPRSSRLGRQAHTLFAESVSLYLEGGGRPIVASS